MRALEIGVYKDGTCNVVCSPNPMDTVEPSYVDHDAPNARTTELLLYGLMAHTALYWVYVVLFVLSLYIHFKKRTTGLRIHVAFLSFTFLLSSIAYFATAHAIMKVIIKPVWSHSNYYYLVLRPLVEVIQMGLPPYTRIGYILSNLAADLYITYRCYIVWGQSKRVIIFPLILIATTLVAQIGFGSYDTVIPFITFYGAFSLSIVTNVLVTGLTAGRIWWIGRKAKQILPHKVLGRYRRAVQVVLESGLLYPTSLVLVVIALVLGRETALDCFIATNLCIVNIAPTIIIIRVGLGVSTDDVETTIRMVQATTTLAGNEELQIVKV